MNKELKTYVNITFEGHYPVGTSAVIIAENKLQAKAILELELEQKGLKQEVNHTHFILIPTDTPKAIILNNGDY